MKNIDIEVVLKITDTYKGQSISFEIRRNGSLQATDLIFYWSYSFSLVAIPSIIQFHLKVMTSQGINDEYPNIEHMRS